MTTETEQLQRSWIANAAAWTDAVRKQSIESRRLVTDAAMISAVVELHPRRVLDLGCGEGWLSRALASHGIAVTGIDASAPLIHAAQELGGGEFMTLTYEEIVADPTRLGAKFDAIAANFSILDDRAEDLLRALRSALAENGRLSIQSVHPLFLGNDVPYIDGWRTETFAAMPGEWHESMPWYFRTVGTWTRTLANSGYTIAEIREPQYPDRPVPASILFICGMK
jgi:SAM-dependent methyltransferase